MRKRNYGRALQALFLAGIMGIFWLQSGSYQAAGRIYEYLKQEAGAGQAVQAEEADSQAELLTMQNIQAEYMNSMQRKQELIELNGTAAGLLGMQGFYSRDGIYAVDGTYIMSPSPQTSTDYEYEQTLQLRDFLKERGIHLVYVNEPTKYLDDAVFRDSFGIESFSNRNADLFLERIAEAGIPVIDLREELVQSGMDIRDMFYRTDHHWTVPSGLWAAEKMAEGLNRYCGYAVDLNLYDASNFTYREWKNCWLGEQGRKIASSYIGLDDFTEIKPKFKTSFTFKYGEDRVQGTFDDFVNEDVYRTDAGRDLYSEPSWHYSYAQTDVKNNQVDQGKVLVLGDSYEQVTVPFLALGVSEVDSLILRGYEGSLREYIEAGGYDTVLICYAQFMIGAHDDPGSANYAMFSFE